MHSLTALLTNIRDDLSMQMVQNEHICLLNATGINVDVLMPALSKLLPGVLLIENIIVVTQKQRLHSR